MQLQAKQSTDRLVGLINWCSYNTSFYGPIDLHNSSCFEFESETEMEFDHSSYNELICQLVTLILWKMS